MEYTLTPCPIFRDHLRRTLILFDRNSISRVLPAYAAEVHAHWGQNLTPAHDICAVASRHNPTRDLRGDWPKTLIDYCPDYRSGRGRQGRSDTLCAALRQAAILHEAQCSPAEIIDLMTASLVALMRHQGTQDALGLLVSKRTIWSVLAAHDSTLPLKLKRLMRDRIVFGDAAWDAGAWDSFCRDLSALLGIGQAPAPAATGFLEFIEEGAIDREAQARQGLRTVFVHDGISIKLGSIHSVKGKTVDSILIAETEVWRGPGRDERAMDLALTLPHAFGLENRDFGASPVQLAAATNIFVALTRPTQLLSCALRKEAASDRLIAAARAQGWVISDLTP